MPNSVPASIAAIDLGSNSFHLIVAEPSHGHIKVVDRMREVIRLGAGLDSDNQLKPAAMAQALACLQRFGDRVRHLTHGSVRVVGTNALRKARNSVAFLRQAESALGHPIDVVSGIEEARLVYLGVSHGLADDTGRRLVMDIGGGSTELIIGQRFEPLAMESLHMGCVSMSERCFDDGKIDAKRLRAAEIIARQELEPIAESFRAHGWQTVVGASGTLLAIAEILSSSGWSSDGITRAGLRELRAAIIELGSAEALAKLNVAVDRRPVFAGGLAIALGAFEELGFERMQVSDSALREGVLYDLMGRIHHEDVRERTVEHLMQRFAVDRTQVERVVGTAQRLFDQTADEWHLHDEESSQLLRWAARLHEIGTTVSHSQYQKHGAYLLQYLDMPGFSRGEQRRLAALVRGHRRKLPEPDVFATGTNDPQPLIKLCLLLRLAVVLHRARSVTPVPPLSLVVEGTTLKLNFPKGWLDSHALVSADLEQEANYVKSIGYKLKSK
ncbi:MAG: exopolyphosphatase [Gammaproteobacteria bacterium]|nr:exopolyphosphatase [Gammaproteobacteria bacterium]